MTPATATFRSPATACRRMSLRPRLTRFRRRGYQRYLPSAPRSISFLLGEALVLHHHVVGLRPHVAPTPSGLTHEGQIVLAMSVMATMLFITEAVPLPTVPLLIIIGEVVLLKVDPTKVAQSLMTDSVLFIMGSLMLAVAIVKQRLDKRIAWWIVR